MELGGGIGTLAIACALKIGGDRVYSYEVPVKPLNDEIARIKPTVLIMDVQGSEGKLLSFANLSTVSKLLVEVHPDMLGLSNANGLRRNLRTQGFEEIDRSGQSFLYIRK